MRTASKMATPGGGTTTTTTAANTVTFSSTVAQLSDTVRSGNSSGDTTTLRHRRLLKQKSNRHIDIATGRQTIRHQSVVVVNEDAREARSRWSRMTSRRTKSLAGVMEGADNNNDLRSVEEDPASKNQYRIRAHYSKYKHGNKSLKGRIRRWWEVPSTAAKHMVADYLLWSFRSSFWSVALASYAEFLGLVIVFALFVFAVGQAQPECISVAGGEY